MKNKLELNVVARDLGESFAGNQNQKAFKGAILAKFDSLEMDDADYPAFEQMAFQAKAVAEGLQGQPLITETLRIASVAKQAKEQAA